MLPKVDHLEDLIGGAIPIAFGSQVSNESFFVIKGVGKRASSVIQFFIAEYVVESHVAVFTEELNLLVRNLKWVLKQF